MSFKKRQRKRERHRNLPQIQTTSSPSNQLHPRTKLSKDLLLMKRVQRREKSYHHSVNSQINLITKSHQ